MYENEGTKQQRGDPSHYVKIVDSAQDLTLSGRYMAVTLLRLFVNVPLCDEYDDKRIKCFTLLEVLFHNLWDYRLEVPHWVKMVDSEGFQHDGDPEGSWEFRRAILPGEEKTADVEVAFPEFERTLEGRAKTQGWVWFDELPDGVMPHRFIFHFYVFEPGATSGWVKETETLEFTINDHIVNSIKQLPG